MIDDADGCQTQPTRSFAILRNFLNGFPASCRCFSKRSRVTCEASLHFLSNHDIMSAFCSFASGPLLRTDSEQLRPVVCRQRARRNPKTTIRMNTEEKVMTRDVTNQTNHSSPPQRTLYPPIDPYDSGLLEVSSIHRVYYEVSGNPNGVPVCFVHGGPGAGTVPLHRTFFDPKGME